MKTLERFEPQRLSTPHNSFSYSEANEFEVTVQPMTSVIYKIKLFGAIEDASQFNPAIEAFERAGPDDHVLIHLSTPGGSADAADTFITSMRNCEAPVHIAASGTVASAGTLILLNAPSFSLSENFSAMFHNGSWGTWGKHHEVLAQNAYYAKAMERLCRSSYEGFFTEEELQLLIDGKDYYMDGEEFVRRFETRQRFLKEKYPCTCNNCEVPTSDIAAYMAAIMSPPEEDVLEFENVEPTPAPKPAPRKRAKKKA